MFKIIWKIKINFEMIKKNIKIRNSNRNTYRFVYFYYEISQKRYMKTKLNSMNFKVDQ